MSSQQRVSVMHPASSRRRSTPSRSSSSASSTPRTSGSRSAWRSSAAAPPASPAPTGCCSCSATTEALLERLGEVPVAVIEKAKTCGGHNLSGAVMRPGPLQELFPDLSREDWRKERFAFGEVTKEVGLHAAQRQDQAAGPDRRRRTSRTTATRSSRWPRWRATSSAQAEEAGAYVLTETSATQLIVEDGTRRRRALGRQGPRQGRRAAGQLRARHRHQGPGDGARRGLLGPPHRRRDQGVRARPTAASRRSGSSASRRSGRSPSRSTA